MDDTHLYYEENAEVWHKTHPITSEVKPLVDDFISLLKGNRVLDVGCGPGRYMSYFSQHGLDVVGVDLAIACLDRARQEVPAASFAKMDMRHLAFQNNSFHGLWACASFLHIPKKEARSTLDEFFRALLPQGILYLAMKEGNGEVYLSEPSGHNRFFALYQQKELEQLLAESSFEITLCRKLMLREWNWLSFYATKKGI